MTADGGQRTDDRKKKPQGLRCPKCNCADFYDEDGRPAGFGTTHKLNLSGAVRRYKYCRNCGKRVRTKEVIDKILPD